MRILRRRRLGDRPLTCHEVAERLQRFLDGELDDAQIARRVAEHLEDCRRCGLEATVYREIKAALARQAPALPDTAVRNLRRFGEQLARDTRDTHSNGDDDGQAEGEP